MNKILAVLVMLAGLPSLASAQVSVQAECFSTLRDNLRETVIMSEQADYLDQITYEQLESQFSKKYKTMSSLGVGIGLDQPRFATRLFSFGEPTGYIHPPQTFMPDSVRSEVWSTSTNQYIVAEEYVLDDSGAEHFLGCFFIGMTAPDLMAVTADNYAGDAPGISLFKVAPDASYKAWFAEAPSFNPAGEPLVTWTKMFIYPKAATNPCFSKYTVAEAYPANKVDSFALLDFFAQPYLKVEEFDEVTGLPITKYMDLESGEELETPPELLPVLPSVINQTHPLASYYQAISAAFPDFAKLLSVRGTLKFSTFVEMVTDENLNPELVKFMATFRQTRQLNEYYKIKQNSATSDSVTGPEFDRQIALLQHGDWTVAKLRSGETFESLSYSDEVQADTRAVPEPEEGKSKNNIIVYIFATMIVLLIIGIIYRQLNKVSAYE